jgi:hypothetical protein
MPGYVPAVNETTAPVQFDGAVTLAGASLSGLASGGSPSQQGLLAWTFPLALASGTASAAAANGLLYLAGMSLPANTTVSNIWLYSQAAASTVTASQNFAGLYSSSGALLAGTAATTLDVPVATAGIVKGPLAAPYTTTASGTYYVGCFFNATTNLKFFTPAGFVTVTTSATSYQGFGALTAATYQFAVNGSGLTTALPTTITMSSNTLTGSFAYWAGLS